MLDQASFRMEESKLLSSNYDSSYQLTSKRGSEGHRSDFTFNPSMTSTLVSRSDSARPCSPSYGSRGDTSTMVISESAAASQSSTPEADKVPLLSEKIRKKKQG